MLVNVNLFSNIEREERLNAPFIYLSLRNASLVLRYHSIASCICKVDISAIAICHL